MLNRTQILLLALTALFLIGLFSPEIYDTDFWWHLRAGQYIVQTRSLPSPDPFAWTTTGAHDTYAGESRTRQFNLTHEWLAQGAMYAAWSVGGFAGIVALRALSLTLVCGLIGLIVWRRRSSFPAAIAAALAASSVFATFALDRPYQVTFLFLAATMALLGAVGQTFRLRTRFPAGPAGCKPAAATRRPPLSVASAAAIPDLGQLSRRLFSGMGGAGRALRGVAGAPRA